MQIPIALWLSALALVIGLPLAVELGFRLYVARTSGSVSDLVGEDQGWAAIVAGGLTLLAILLAFTVSMATERFELRRQLVVEEANAISTVYLRSQLFDEPARHRLGRLIAGYAQDRKAAYLAGEDPTRVAASIARTEPH